MSIGRLHFSSDYYPAKYLSIRFQISSMPWSRKFSHYLMVRFCTYGFHVFVSRKGQVIE